MPVQSSAKREAIKASLESLKLAKKFDYKPDFIRRDRKRAPLPAKMIAYDLETTRIAVGTPRPLYLTAYSQNPPFSIDGAIQDMQHLRAILRARFLLPEYSGCKFVAWNGNRYDAYFIAAALLRDEDLTLKPYMTKSKALRGLRIESKESSDVWEFLDGIAMLGLTGLSLEKLLDNFAPDYRKLKEDIDFSVEEFDPENPKHRAYAYRDSKGLWHAMNRAQNILMQTFHAPLSVTMGGVCIKIFQNHIPKDIVIESLTPDIETIVRQYVMRGGFCYCVKRYHGPIWKYDINQAYAAAMRDSDLPCGPALSGKGIPPKNVRCFLVRISAVKPDNSIPFYYRTLIDGRLRTLFATTEIRDTWITSVEYRQLISEGWNIRTFEFYAWAEFFSMYDYVSKLERLRTTCEGGPSGPIGTMVKAVGNHSYGKTVEQIEPLQFILAAECPDDCLPYYGDGGEPFAHVFYRFDDERKPKNYHKPQIGAFITAHVRMVLRRAALKSPDTWLYADTDCVVFSSDVTELLDIDSKRYGAWKIEESGAVYRIIAKKVYAQDGDSGKLKRSAKGLHVRELSAADFADWYEGAAPVQTQTQIQNFLAVMQGAEMFRSQTRRGTAVDCST